jgi:hypothetical protein
MKNSFDQDPTIQIKAVSIIGDGNCGFRVAALYKEKKALSSEELTKAAQDTRVEFVKFAKARLSSRIEELKNDTSGDGLTNTYLATEALEQLDTDKYDTDPNTLVKDDHGKEVSRDHLYLRSDYFGYMAEYLKKPMLIFSEVSGQTYYYRNTREVFELSLTSSQTDIASFMKLMNDGDTPAVFHHVDNHFQTFVNKNNEFLSKEDLADATLPLIKFCSQMSEVNTLHKKTLEQNDNSDNTQELVKKNKLADDLGIKLGVRVNNAGLVVPLFIHPENIVFANNLQQQNNQRQGVMSNEQASINNAQQKTNDNATHDLINNMSQGDLRDQQQALWKYEAAQQRKQQGAQLALKINQEQQDEQFALKINQEQQDEQLALKIEQQQQDEQLAFKINQEQQDEQLAFKINQEQQDERLALEIEQQQLKAECANFNLDESGQSPTNSLAQSSVVELERQNNSHMRIDAEQLQKPANESLVNEAAISQLLEQDMQQLALKVNQERQDAQLALEIEQQQLKAEGANFNLDDSGQNPTNPLAQSSEVTLVRQDDNSQISNAADPLQNPSNQRIQALIENDNSQISNGAELDSTQKAFKDVADRIKAAGSQNNSDLKALKQELVNNLFKNRNVQTDQLDLNTAQRRRYFTQAVNHIAKELDVAKQSGWGKFASSIKDSFAGYDKKEHFTKTFKPQVDEVIKSLKSDATNEAPANGYNKGNKNRGARIW